MSRLLDSIHDSAKGLNDAKLIDSVTTREFDAMCLPEVKDLKPSKLKEIRENEKVSQAVFAKCLNVTKSTVCKWESGERRPRGSSLKLLNMVAEKGLDVLL
jgi:putative transcriptional regulator